MIELNEQQESEIRKHGEQEYPHECCGLLIGRIADEGRTRIVEETYPVANAWGGEGERHHRMLIKPEDYMRAERSFRDRGIGVIGNYHSHPDHPAVPSEFDLKNLAPWPTMSYIVVSVREGKTVDVRSWELEADGTRFNEEEISKGD
ncbi:MAG: M67 family metallopeptidase [Pyrinomonadaceae bacterium]|nr:M67 family metallopeptidase [Pyrinomonadaceae bacterium]